MNVDDVPVVRPSHKRVRGVWRWCFPVLVAVVPVILSACVWKPEIVTADPSFTSSELVAGKNAVMPVKFDNDKAIPAERAKMAGGLLRAIVQLRSDIPSLTNPAHTRAIQGSIDDEAVFLRAYDYDEKTGDPKSLESFRESLGARYLILSRLHYEQQVAGTGQSMGHSTVESTLSGTVSILDTNTGKTVWAGTFSSTRGGVDTLVDPRPSAHALPFFSTFVKEWPGGS